MPTFSVSAASRRISRRIASIIASLTCLLIAHGSLLRHATATYLSRLLNSNICTNAASPGAAATCVTEYRSRLLSPHTSSRVCTASSTCLSPLLSGHVPARHTTIDPTFMPYLPRCRACARTHAAHTRAHRGFQAAFVTTFPPAFVIPTGGGRWRTVWTL